MQVALFWSSAYVTGLLQAGSGRDNPTPLTAGSSQARSMSPQPGRGDCLAALVRSSRFYKLWLGL